MTDPAPVRIGSYTGEVRGPLATPDGQAWLARLGDEAARAERQRAQGGAAIFYTVAPGSDGPLPVAVKAYGRPHGLKALGDRRRGTPAERAWRIALRLQAAGIGTPEPLAWLERWQDDRLLESCFIARRIEGALNGRDELNRLLRHEAFTDRLIPFMQALADAIRALHEAGVLHGDLGNQNILLRRTGPAAWTDVMFIDLNRARVQDGPLGLADRARDLYRISLPSDLLRCFFQMYFRGEAPAAFLAAEARLRARYAWHTRTRVLRHPIAQYRLRRTQDPLLDYPSPPEVWIWDEKSAQPVNAEVSRVRNRHIPRRTFALLARSAAPALGPVRRAFHALREGAYGEPVPLAGRFALAVEPRPASWATERDWLRAAGPVPLLVRFYRHKGPEQWDFALAAVRDLRAAGHPVAAALVQDRRAVTEPSAWAAMAEHVVPPLAGLAEWIEVGHAVNRVKWGLWDLASYRKLVEPLAALRAAYPALRLMGPAGIDFEYLHVLAALKVLPRGFRFDALSHHLYVDRRGAPERPQGAFAALEKFALARAIARTSPHCEDRLIVSEVNWPVLGTREYSPVGTPYTHPGQVLRAPNVTPEDYADYMVRYLLQAACSGLVERVYWWRLAAHGFGLIDERTVEQQGQPWLPRPAWFAYLHLLRTLGDAVFQRNLDAPPQSNAHLFRRPDGEQVVVAYTWGAPAPWQPPFAFARSETRAGEAVVAAGLTGHPVYYRGVTAETPRAPGGV